MTKSLSLQAKLLLLFLISVLVLVVITVSVVQRAALQQSTEQLRQQLSASAKVLEFKLNTDRTALEESLQVLARDFNTKSLIASAQNDKESLRVMLINHQQRLDADIALAAESDGRILASSAAAVDHSGLVLQSLTGAGLHLIKNEDRRYLLSTVPVYFVESSKDVNAWLSMGSQLENLPLSELTRLTGMEVAFAAERNGQQQILVSSIPFLQDQIFNLQQKTPGAVLSTDTGEFYYDMIPLAEDFYGMILVPRAGAFLSYQSLLWQIAVIVLLVGAVILLLVTLIAHGITRPLNRLVAVSNRISQGDYSESIDTGNSLEVAALAEAFTTMQGNIAEREKAIEQLAYFDSLTELPNRNAFRDELARSVGDVSQQIALFLIDINRFKEINDTIGHEQGDLLLRLVASRLAGRNFGKVFVAHMGGDEFALLLFETDSNKIIRIAEKVHATFEEPFSLRDLDVEPSVSVGISVYPDHRESPNKLLQCADIALNHCKEQQSAYSIYEAGMDKFSVQRLSLMSDLKTAIVDDELSLFVQPKVNLRSGSIRTVECLLRWQHSEQGHIYPDDFIPQAEQTGVIRELTQWVLSKSVKLAKDWQDAGIQVDVAVNISALDLVDLRLPNTMRALLQAHQLPADKIVLEVTESALMSDPDVALQTLWRLREMGICLSIDDFGTGYSSMEKLKQMPVSELKIDKSFVMDIVDARDDKAIVRSVISLGHSLGMRIVAEGVESADAMKLLRSFGCDVGQGYFFSKPMPAEAFPAWLAEFREQPDPGNQNVTAFPG